MTPTFSEQTPGPLPFLLVGPHHQFYIWTRGIRLVRRRAGIKRHSIGRRPGSRQSWVRNGLVSIQWVYSRLSDRTFHFYAPCEGERR